MDSNDNELKTASSENRESKLESVNSPPEYPELDKPTLASLDNLLFGSQPNPQDVERWHTQGFMFSEHSNLPFGLIQLYGGPCGILAPIQAYILRDMIFSPNRIQSFQNNDVPLRPNNAQRSEALVRTLSDIIVRSASSDEYIVLLTSDGERILRTPSVNAINIRAFISSNMSSFHSKIGVLLFIYTVILNRGIKQVLADIDDPQPLVQRFGHCSQELVNLMICGRASTNVFDGEKVLGDSEEQNEHAYSLKGIPQQNEIGFLTVLEALRYSKVGDYYKTPKCPIWVVGSSSHYTVMFALNSNIGKLSPEEERKRTMKKIFQQLDPHENGFVLFDKLPELIALTDLQFTAEQIRKEIKGDAEVLLFLDFFAAILQCEASDQDWSCSACTFLNVASNLSCEICQTIKPETKLVKDVVANHELVPSNFTLYHYNGIEGHKNAQAECRCVKVWPDQGDPSNWGHEGLAEVIQTKWPYALVQFPGEFPHEPKIT
uniref:Ubiquitin carboxyl-terminal hydrolase MINDY n=1 Tax=Hirondellea gigas TaxID=1518452 RepID=A0A6A7GB45_9CRUS